MRKKSYLLFLAAVMILMTIFAGCTTKQADPSPSPGSSTAQPSSTEPSKSPEPTEPEQLTEITLPISKEPITLTIYTALNAPDLQYFTNLAETPVAKEIMKRTGINLKFIHPPVGQEKEQFNIMLASGDRPDIVVGMFNDYKGGPSQAVADGLIIDPTELVQKYAPNFKRLLANDPMADKVVRNAEGTFLGGFGASMSLDKPFGEDHAYVGMMIRQDYLDKVSLPMPETIDEWYTVLKAFKDQLGLEAPFAWNHNGKPGSDILENSSIIASAFGVKGKDFYHDNNVVKYAPIEPGYKEYLTVLNKWYKEGLITKDFATHTYDEHVLSEMQSGKSGAAAMHLYWYASIKDKMEPGAKLVPALSPVVNKGDRLRLRDAYGWFVSKANAKHITTNNKYPIESVKLIDWLYSEEAKLLTNWGIEGESYTLVDGNPQFTDMYKEDQAKVGSMYSPNRLKQNMDDRMNMLQYPLPEQHEAFDLWEGQATNEMALPPGRIFTDEEKNENDKIMTEVETYQGEMFLKFVMGIEPLDKFDSYVNTIKSLKIDNVIKNNQAALDRLNSRS